VTDPSRRRPRRSPTAVERRAARAEIDDPSLVLEAALRFLEARQRSAAEVRRRLLLNGYRQDLVEGAIQRLTELAMLDDAAFARSWVESRDRARPRGERVLRRELALKGVDRDVVDDVIEERDSEAAAEQAGGQTPDERAARRLLARNERALARVADPRARRRRAYALLARNGFDSETAVAAIDAAGLSSG
jgi:regulatory protein